jgi:hypothetical protein
VVLGGERGVEPAQVRVDHADPHALSAVVGHSSRARAIAPNS